MKDYIRLKRKNKSIYTWQCKLYVPVPRKVKNRFAEASRMVHMSQAELGAVLIMHYLENPKVLTEAVMAYRKHDQKEYMEQRRIELSSDNHPAPSANQVQGGTDDED